MIRTLRAVVAVLVLCLFAGSCQVLSWSMEVPAQVAGGSIFAMMVTGTTSFGSQTNAAVIQLPDGFEVVGAYAYVTSDDYAFASYAGGGARDDANVLAAYTAEPGHHLASFQGMGPSPGEHATFISVSLKIYVRAPTVVGPYRVKLALGNLGMLGQPPYVHQQPPGITDFAAIATPAHFRDVQVVAAPAPPPFTPVEMDTWDTLQAASSFAMGDLDGDGRDDFVEIESSHPRVYLRRDSGSQEITGNLSHPAYVSRVEIADFDGDGRGDLLMFPGTVPVDPQVAFGSGGPQWTPGTMSTVPLDARDPAVADLTGDGRPDVLVRVASDWIVYRANPDRTFTAMPTGLPVTSIWIVDDLDGDGVAEIVASTASGTVQLWRSDGLGGWVLVGDMQLGGIITPYTQPFLAIDLNGDGKKEVIRSGSSIGYRYTGLGLVQIWAQPIGFRHALAMDYDRDGLDDIVTSQNSGLQLLHNSFGGFFANVPLPSSAGFRLIFGPALLAAVDIDGDSFPDLAVQATEGPMIWRNTMTGAGRYGAACAGTGFAAPQLSVLGTVAPGQSVTLQLTGALPNGPALVWAGLSKRTWAGLPLLPLGLDFVGAAGCELLAEPSVIVPKTADASGLITHVLPLPSLLPTDTLTFFLQGAVFAPGANAFPFLFSQGLALKMQ